MSAALQKEFDAQLAKSRKSTEALQAQLDAKDLRAQIKKDNASMIAHMVLSEVSAIRVPEDGRDGMDGIDGIPGINGIRGPKGERGVTGKEGTVGKPGAKGPKGDVGPAGKDGKDGVDGVVGYKGDAGPQGIPGEAGKDGLDGRDGTNGKDGINGKDGAIGEPGVAGRDGNDGLKGSDGLTGKNGVDGKKGTKGDQGAKGLTGKQGPKGKDGAKGKPGETGVGIKDIQAYGQNLHIKLTDGKTKQVYMPVRGSGGGNAPVPPMDIQRAIRTPLTATGFVSDNVQDGMIELKNKIVQSSVGNPFDVGTSEAFMFTFNPYDETHDGEFVYDDTTNQLVSKTIETSADVVLYTVNFSYNGTQLESKLVSDEINNDSVRVDFTYDIKGRLIDKAHTYIA